MNPGMYSANSELWGTPKAVFDALDEEFLFDLDPCPGEATLGGMFLHELQDGLSEPWSPFKTAFVNPPYGRAITSWIERAIDQLRQTKVGDPRAVLLLPARTDTSWWHDLILPNAKEIRFIRGRLGFTGVTPKMEGHRHHKLRSRAPFPSVVVVL